MATFPQGVGISLRREHHDEVLRTSRRIDWLEIQPENFMTFGGRSAQVLDRCAEKWPVVPHGVALSLGGPDPLSTDYLSSLKALIHRVDAPYFSEHACYSSAGGVLFHDLLPLPFTEEAAIHLAKRIRQTRDHLGIEVMIENITYYAVMPTSALTEGEFLTAVTDEANCGLLLDINNIYVNAVNHKLDPRAVLRELPLKRARQIHLAGHRNDGDLLIDDHGAAVISEVWQLYRESVELLGPLPALIEWENHLPPLDGVLDEADRARAIQEQVCGHRS